MYKDTDDIMPFWGSETTSKGGRDPLAVQNSSIVIYSDMITGITNVTQRVRYNGFFCWLLMLIAKRIADIDIAKIDNSALQTLYIRRAELLMAYNVFSNFTDVTSVSGTWYAAKNFEGDTINLAKGADIDNKPNVYWQHGMGVFGQYYIGVMSQLKLLYVPDASHKTYRVTSVGEKLGRAFGKSVSDEVEGFFWNAIYDGHLPKSQLTYFAPMALHLINEKDELDAYFAILTQADRKDFAGNDIKHRLESIKLILQYIDGEGKSVERKNLTLSFLQCNFEYCMAHKMDVSEERLAWFLYELNELTHSAYEAFHYAVLNKTNDEYLPLDYVLNELKNDYESFCAIENLMISGTPHLLNSSMHEIYRLKNYGCYIFLAHKMILELYDSISPYIELLYNFAIEHRYDVQHNGFSPKLLQRLITVAPGDNWDDIERCIYSAINDHLNSSYSKSSIGQGLVHNYIIEEGLIRRLRTTTPIRTSPRINNVLQYMEDIHWIGRKEEYYVVLETGQKLLAS